MSEISEKQLEANHSNAKLGGVKSEAGKAISKLNATKHNILSNLFNDNEAQRFETIKIRFTKEYKPQTVTEEILVERLATWYIRLQRAVIAEVEQMKKISNPEVTEEIFPYGSLMETKIIKKGYKPKINDEDIELLEKTYLRYESTIERNFYKALRELQRLKTNNKEKENGFVS